MLYAGDSCRCSYRIKGHNTAATHLWVFFCFMFLISTLFHHTLDDPDFRPTLATPPNMRGPNVTIHLVRFACIDQSPWPKNSRRPGRIALGAPRVPRMTAEARCEEKAWHQEFLVHTERTYSKTESTTDCKAGSNCQTLRNTEFLMFILNIVKKIERVSSCSFINVWCS